MPLSKPIIVTPPLFAVTGLGSGIKPPSVRFNGMYIEGLLEKDPT